MSYLLSTILGALVMFGLPVLGALAILSPWNQQRSSRARAYRLAHRRELPWWLP